MGERLGIVLKSFVPHKQVLVMLDQQHGKILLTPLASRPCVGALVSYHVASRRTLPSMHAIDQRGLPLSLARNDLLFFHHVLEICYYFLPLEHIVSELFELLHELYNPQLSLLSSKYKRIFLVRLFLALGMYPETAGKRWHLITPWLQTGMESVMQGPLDVELDTQIRSWLLYCLALHPYVKRFKTVHLFDD